MPSREPGGADSPPGIDAKAPSDYTGQPSIKAPSYRTKMISRIRMRITAPMLMYTECLLSS
jgi:hypothetical protein